MRILRWTVIVLIVLVVAFVGGAYLLPREVEVERTARIDAPPAEVFPHINSLQKTEAWSPWLHRDPDTVLTYAGPPEGVGNSMRWESEHPQVGSGSQEIVVSQPDSRIESDLDFGEMGTARAWWQLDPAGDGTDVTWGLRTDMGSNPVGRWMGLMMDRWVGADYEDGLARLKALVEG